MERIVRYLNQEKWGLVKKYIVDGVVDWNFLVDQTNGLLHYLAYHHQIELIETINPEVLPELVTQANTEGDTIGHIAAKLHDPELLGLAIGLNSALLYIRNELGCTLIYYLVTDHGLVRNIAQSVDLADHYLNKEYTLLEYYILNKNLSMVKFLLDHIQLNKFSDQAPMAVVLSENTFDDKIYLLEQLVEHGIDVNTLDHKYLSPLVMAVRLNNGLSKFLLESGADPNYYGPENNDHPLTVAIANGNDSLVNLLLDYDSDTNVPDKYLQTPLHHLFQPNIILPIQTKQRLLKRVSNINAADHRMNTILSLLIQNDNWHTYENILEESKLKIYLKNKDGAKPIDFIKEDELNSFYYLVYRSYLSRLDSDINWIDSIDKKVSLLLENNEDIGQYKSYIMGKIINQQSYPLAKHSHLPIKLLVPPKTNITHFSAYTYNYICFLYYILQKYPMVKIPSMAPGQMENKTLKQLYHELIEDYTTADTPDNAIFRSIIRDYLNHSPALVNHIIIWKNNRMYFFSPYIVQGIYETIKKYPDTIYILLKLTIISDKNFNHANMVIFDIHKHTIERFDPYGKVPFLDSQSVDTLLESFFRDYFPNEQYVPAAQLSNGISFQIFSDENNDANYVENDPAGFCIAWCIWYTEMRAQNPNIDPKLLIQRTIYQINKDDDQFKDFIRNYSDYLDTEKNHILEQSGLPKKYWYMQKIPILAYRSYLKYIRRIYYDILSASNMV